MRRKIYLIIVLILSACTTPLVSSELSSTPEIVSTATSVPASYPTQTASPTSTHIPLYPVSVGTPFPLQLRQITVQNATILIELVHYGSENDIVLTEITSGNNSIQDTNHGVKISTSENELYYVATL